MTLLFLISVIFQNGIIAVPSEPPKPLEQYKEQLHIQRLEIAVQKLTDENENFKRQLDDVMESKVALYAIIEDIIASQNDKIASQNEKIASRNDKIASLSGKIDTMREDMILGEQRETMQVSFSKFLISKIHSAAFFAFYWINLTNQSNQINETDIFCPQKQAGN